MQFGSGIMSRIPGESRTATLGYPRSIPRMGGRFTFPTEIPGSQEYNPKPYGNIP